MLVLVLFLINLQDNPKYGRILDLISEDYTKGQILDELGLGKSQGYADIKAAQALAKKLYFGE